MKILFLVAKSVLGGHVLSALTIARGMKKHGHDVVFAAASGTMTSVIQNQFPFIDIEIPIFHGTRQTYFTWQSFARITRLKKIVKNEHIEMIHAFDARSYIHSYIAGLLTDTPVTCTLCGGIDPYYNIPVSQKIIVFSEEQKDKMVRVFGWKEKYVEVIRTRLDIEQIVSDPLHQQNEIISKLGIRSNVPTIMMISSFNDIKIKSIYNVLEAMELLLTKGITAQMVFIGGKGILFEQVKSEAEEINNKFNKKHIFFTGPVINAYGLLSHADIVLGMGRSVFEGMAYGKPTIIVGNNGFAGLMSPESIDDIAHYNFSGRNQKSYNSHDVLTDELIRVLTDSEVRRKVAEFGKNFVLKEIDVNHGLSRIEAVYRANIENKTKIFQIHQWLSVCKIMIPIWRDNWWHTIGMPIKRMLGLVK